jgi:hypothetical protein
MSNEAVKGLTPGELFAELKTVLPPLTEMILRVGRDTSIEIRLDTFDWAWPLFMNQERSKSLDDLLKRARIFSISCQEEGTAEWSPTFRAGDLLQSERGIWLVLSQSKRTHEEPTPG